MSASTPIDVPEPMEFHLQRERIWRSGIKEFKSNKEGTALWQETSLVRRALSQAINAEGLDSRLGVPDYKLAELLVDRIISNIYLFEHQQQWLAGNGINVSKEDKEFSGDLSR